MNLKLHSTYLSTQQKFVLNRCFLHIHAITCMYLSSFVEENPWVGSGSSIWPRSSEFALKVPDAMDGSEGPQLQPPEPPQMEPPESTLSEGNGNQGMSHVNVRHFGRMLGSIP